MLKATNNFIFRNKYNKKKSKYAVLISIIMHIMICIILYKQIVLQKQKNFHTINTLYLKSPDNNHSDKIKITNTQHHSSTKEPNTAVHKQTPKQNNSNHSDKIKITNTQHHSSTKEPNTAVHKQTPKKNVNHVENLKLIKPKSNDNDTDLIKLKNLLNTLSTNHNMQPKNQNLKTNILKNQNDYHQYNKQKNEVNIYKDMIKEAIQKKLYNASSYVGQECNLKIQIGRNGKLISVNAISGDPILCQAAIMAVKSANIPQPPNTYIYEKFKDITLRFSP